MTSFESLNMDVNSGDEVGEESMEVESTDREADSESDGDTSESDGDTSESDGDTSESDGEDFGGYDEDFDGACSEDEEVAVVEEESMVDIEDIVKPEEVSPRGVYSSVGFMGADAHPQKLIEGASQGVAPRPDITYRLNIHEDYYKQKNGRPALLSAPQLEVVCLANQVHQEVFKDAQGQQARKGFFIGDGTGVGKSREMVGILFEYYLSRALVVFKAEGHSDVYEKALFVTTAQTLFPQMQKEFETLFQKNFTPMFVNSSNAITRNPRKKDNSQSTLCLGMNVLMVTYKALTMKKKWESILAWLGEDFNGHIFFDEAHSAKGAYNKTKKSNVGTKVVELQRTYPDARVTYSTATAASEIHHLLVFERLALWGKDMRFKDSRAFQDALKLRDIGGLELLGIQLKEAGQFLSRQISFDGVDVHVLKADTHQYVLDVYDMAGDLIVLLLEYISRELMISSLKDKAPTAYENLQKIKGSFYQGSLSFFTSLIVSSKLSYVHAYAREYLRQNYAVIIGMQQTGENRFDKFRDQKANGGMPFSNAGEILRAIMESMGIKLGYPKAYFSNSKDILNLWRKKEEEKEHKEKKFTPNKGWKEFERKTGGKRECDRVCRYTSQHPKKSIDPKSLVNLLRSKRRARPYKIDKWPESSVGSFMAGKYPKLRTPANLKWDLNAAKNNLNGTTLAELFHTLYLLLPINPMDDLRNRFRQIDLWGRYYPVAELSGRKASYDWKPETSSFGVFPREKDEILREKDRFMSGEKVVAVITDAASTGMSLHADRACGNRRRRAHFTIEFGFSPDNILQQLGRSHRSNQVSAPIYLLIKSSIAGEVRFTSVTVKRLKQMGAICHGHSLASPITASIQNSIATEYGLKGIRAALADIRKSPANAYLAHVIKLDHLRKNATPKQFNNEDVRRVSHTLNRCLMLPVELQDRFVSTIQTRAEKLISESTRVVYNGILEYPAQMCSVHKMADFIYKLPNGKNGHVYELKHSRVMQWAEAEELYNLGNSKFYVDGESVKLVTTLPEGGIEIRAPFSRILFTNKGSSCYVQCDYSQARRDWIKEVDQFFEKSGCCHFVKHNSCRIEGCEKSWGTKRFLLACGVTDHLLDYMGVNPIQLAKATLENGEIVYGVLVDQDIPGMLAKFRALQTN